MERYSSQQQRRGCSVVPRGNGGGGRGKSAGKKKKAVLLRPVWPCVTSASRVRRRVQFASALHRVRGFPLPFLFLNQHLPLSFFSPVYSSLPLHSLTLSLGVLSKTFSDLRHRLAAIFRKLSDMQRPPANAQKPDALVPASVRLQGTHALV